MRMLLSIVLLTTPSVGVASDCQFQGSGFRVGFEIGADPVVYFEDGRAERYQAYGNGTEVRTLSAFPVVTDPKLIAKDRTGRKIYIGPEVQPISFWVENGEDADPANDVLVWGDERLVARCE